MAQALADVDDLLQQLDRDTEQLQNQNSNIKQEDIKYENLNSEYEIQGIKQEEQYIANGNYQNVKQEDNLKIEEKEQAVSKALQQVQDRIKQQQQTDNTQQNGTVGLKRKKHTWSAISKKEEEQAHQEQQQQQQLDEVLKQQQIDGEQKPKKRRSRWDTSGDGEQENALTKVEDNKQLVTNKFPREVFLPGGIRVVMPPSLTGEDIQIDPQVKRLYDKLNEISRKIMNNEYLHIPEHQRSPSPEPVYDKVGQRLNTREVRWKEKLTLEKNLVIEELIMLDPTYKPPADYKPQKKHKRISIPFSNNPSFNYIGLIIGPRGNTQKRMQKETNTKIAIRGKGSIKEGSNKDPKYDYGEDEELHVLITGDTQDDVERAGVMILELLDQSDDTRNEHKRLQLRELAALNGTLKDEQICYVCGDYTHTATECPKAAQEVYKLPSHMQDLVEQQYAKDVKRMTGQETQGQESEFKSFMATLGGAPPPEEALPGGNQQQANELQRVAAQKAAQKAAQLTATAPKRLGDDLPDDCKIYVGNLGQHVDDMGLKRMFEPFGEVLAATVLMDFGTGQSKGFGFVTHVSASDARRAQTMMSGKIVDGRALVVRLRSDNQGGKQKFGPGENDECKLYVQNIPKDIIEAQVRSTFGRYGPVMDVKIIIDKSTGLGKGYCFVTMDSSATAQAAYRSLNGQEIGGQKVLIKSCSKELQAQLDQERAQEMSQMPPQQPAPPLTPAIGGPGLGQMPSKQQQQGAKITLTLPGQPNFAPPQPSMPYQQPNMVQQSLPHQNIFHQPQSLQRPPNQPPAPPMQGGHLQPPSLGGPPRGPHMGGAQRGPPRPHQIGIPPPVIQQSQHMPPHGQQHRPMGGAPQYVPQYPGHPHQPYMQQGYPGQPGQPQPRNPYGAPQHRGPPRPLIQPGVYHGQQAHQQSYSAVPPPASLQGYPENPPEPEGQPGDEQHMMSEVEKFMQEVAGVR